MDSAAPQAIGFVHDERFVEPFANDPHRVFGKRLFPYSLWTQFNLELVDSPFLLGHRTPSPYDLWVAVKICTTPWTPEHYLPNLAAPHPIFWTFQVARFNFQKELHKFHIYLSDFGGGPKYWPNQHKGGENSEQGPGARDLDENLELAVHVELETGWSPRRVWTMPLGQLRWRSAVISRLKGAELDFWTPIDEERFAEHKAKREARIDARGKELHAADSTLTAEAARKQAHDEYWLEARAGLGRCKTPAN